jgi:hypothetical protein
MKIEKGKSVRLLQAFFFHTITHILSRIKDYCYYTAQGFDLPSDFDTVPMNTMKS